MSLCVPARFNRNAFKQLFIFNLPVENMENSHPKDLDAFFGICDAQVSDIGARICLIYIACVITLDTLAQSAKCKCAQRVL